MRRLLFLLLLLAAPLGRAYAETSTSPGSFDSLIAQIRAVCELSPRDAWPLARQADALISGKDAASMRVRLECALAPATALRDGYEPARQLLIKLIDPAITSADNAELEVLLHVALGDLCLRYGDARQGLRRSQMGLRLVSDGTPLYARMLLLRLAIMSNVAAFQPGQAKVCLDDYMTLGALSNESVRADALLLKALVEGLAGEIGEMRQSLETYAVEGATMADPVKALLYWFLKAWHAYQTGDLADLQACIAAGHATAPTITGPEGDGRFLFLEALLAHRGGKDPAIVARLLDQAGQAFAASGRPGMFPVFLSSIVYPDFALRPLSAPTEVLQALSAYAQPTESQITNACAYLAVAELHSRAGEVAAAEQATRLSLRKFMAAHSKMDTIHADWMLLRGGLLRIDNAHRGESTAYLIILVMLLTILVLVLILRIHTQRHINERLADSVRKSRLAEQAAEHASKLKSQFLSNISHEIKTPMSGLVGMVSILDELVTEPAQRKYIATIRTCTRNLLVLINDLLDLGKMEANRLEIEHVPFSPRDTLSYCGQLSATTAAEKGLRLDIELADGLPASVVGDSTRLGQVISNLLTNAIKFTDSGRVRLHARFVRTLGRAGTLVVEVQDTGVGIPPERLRTVFEPFNHFPSGGSRNGSGSGLGLAISKKLVDLMGGSIAVASTPGLGSTFTVSVPFTIAGDEAETDEDDEDRYDENGHGYVD